MILFADLPCFPTLVFLNLPTLRHVSLKTRYVRELTVNWSVLTTVSLKGDQYCHCCSKHDIAQFLRQTKCVVSCYITVGPPRAEDKICFDTIDLLFLETLHIHEGDFAQAETETEAPSLLDLISAPILVDFRIDSTYREASLLNFVTRAPRISKLHVPYFGKGRSLTFLTELFRYCPLLSVLRLWPFHTDLYTRPRRTRRQFVAALFYRGGRCGAACPRLQHFHITGNIHFSPETFRVLIERKKRYTTAANTLLPWKRVFIYISRMSPTETHRQIADFAEQKRSGGLRC